MNYSNDIRFLSETTHLYYEEHLTQQQIARKLNISRSLVSKLLSKAMEKGIVEIIIHDEDIHPFQSLETRLKQTFHLRDAVCVGIEDERNLKKSIGIQAAKYLARYIHNSKIVAVAAGTTTLETAEAFSPSGSCNGVLFVPMSGGLDDINRDFQANHICSVFASQSGGDYIQLHAPVVVNSMEAKRVLYSEPFIRNVYEKAKEASLAIVGIGNSARWLVPSKSYFNEKDLNQLRQNSDIVGDISFNYFNSYGSLVDCEWNNLVMALNLREIRHIPTIIGVAGGAEKYGCIYVAVVHQMVDILITDNKTASALLTMYEQDRRGKPVL